MSTVAVRHLRLVAPLEARVGVVQRIEDGLRLAAPVGRRVLLVRHLPLGTLPLCGPASVWARRIEDIIRAIAAGAVHGLSPGASRAGAVWFHSMEEMFAALLLLIGRGASTDAWFWRAGAPEWDRRGLAPSIVVIMTTLGRSPEGLTAMARTVMALAQTGHLSRIVAAIDQLVQRRPSTAPEIGAGNRIERMADADRSARIMTRLSVAERTAIEAAMRRSFIEPNRAQWLAEAALIAAAPELMSSPALLARTATAWLLDRSTTPSLDQTLTVRRSLQLEAAEPATPKSHQLPPPTLHARRSSLPDPEPGSPSNLGRELSYDREIQIRGGPRSDQNKPLSIFTGVTHERPSAVAGVLLLVGPLARLRLSEWLDARPELAGEGFGRALLAEIATRARATLDDPIRFLERDERPAFWTDELQAWQIGLDRWLRRRARIRVCDIAQKRGWLTITDTGIDVRFLPAAADIRLRRLALDIDPGWVPWLGLSVRYHYCEEALA